MLSHHDVSALMAARHADPFGALGMGGMFSVVKVRRNQKRGDYTDPGWFKHPPGTVAYEYKGEVPPPVRGGGGSR